MSSCAVHYMDTKSTQANVFSILTKIDEYDFLLKITYLSSLVLISLGIHHTPNEPHTGYFKASSKVFSYKKYIRHSSSMSTGVS